MSDRPISSNNRSFWVVERFEKGKSAGYWNGASSRSFVSDIDTAVQFCRKQDAFWATRGWHWRDTEITEHLMLSGDSSAPEKPPALHAHWNRTLGDVLQGAAGILDVVRREWAEAWSEWDQSVRDGITRELLALQSAPETTTDDGEWVIVYADRDRLDEHFSGAGADAAARARFNQLKVAWTCRLFRCVDKTGYGPAEETSATPHPGACTCPACAPSLWAAGIKGATQPPEKASACPKCEAVRKLGLTSCFEHKQPENGKANEESKDGM